MLHLCHVVVAPLLCGLAMIFSIFTGVGTRCVDGLGEAGRVGCLDVAAAALPGEM